MITDAKIRTAPRNSLDVKLSFRTRKPVIAANTDSRLIIRAATVGSVYFCPVT